MPQLKVAGEQSPKPDLPQPGRPITKEPKCNRHRQEAGGEHYSLLVARKAQSAKEERQDGPRPAHATVSFGPGHPGCGDGQRGDRRLRLAAAQSLEAGVSGH